MYVTKPGTSGGGIHGAPVFGVYAGAAGLRELTAGAMVAGAVGLVGGRRVQEI